MRKNFYLVIFLLEIFAFESGLFADNYLLNGNQTSIINYRLFQNIIPTSETASLNLSYVIPESFESITYSQHVSNFKISFTVDPENKKEWVDKRGNHVMDYAWKNPRQPIEVVISFQTKNTVALKEVVSNAPFPIEGISANLKPYLAHSKMVPSEDKSLRELSSEIVGSAKTEYTAVHNILAWVIDHVNYVLNPEEFGALFTLKTGRGNCQNFSHLAAALMRAQGIPVRIVNGITLKEPYNIEVEDRLLTLNMAEGRHSWIEVYFPDLGWMPFDPQQSELFVSNRFIRIEVGTDNEETMNDGLVRWTRTKGSKEVISFQEGMEAAFLRDEISISGYNQRIGPRRLLLMPGVQTKIEIPEQPVAEKPEKFDPKTLANLRFDKPFIFGNLDYPRNINFAFTRISSQGKDENSQELKKNFLVETAEYVSGNSDYAQMFILKKPILLERIGLALQKFGGRGFLSLEIREDQNGKPGDVAAVSNSVDLQAFQQGRGYDWIDFDFSDQGLILTPDKYWITVRFKGSPIINWFYSYGKPVGPIEGTLMKTGKEDTWMHTMGYEFNYRVIGKAVE